jgi:hypothetical protein
MFYHGNSVVQALVDLFPEIGLQKSQFQRTSHLFIYPCCQPSLSLLISYKDVKHDIGSLRKFFEQYAKDNGFDPLVPEHWYQQATSRLLFIKVCVFFFFFCFNNNFPLHFSFPLSLSPAVLTLYMTREQLE